MPGIIVVAVNGVNAPQGVEMVCIVTGLLRWFGTLNYLTGGYFATSICIFPLFCIILFPNITKINWIR